MYASRDIFVQGNEWAVYSSLYTQHMRELIKDWLIDLYKTGDVCLLDAMWGALWYSGFTWYLD